MGYREEFDLYRDPNRLLQPYKNPNASASGNGLLYTSEMIIVLDKLGLINEQERQDFEFVIQACEVAPGLLRRTPTNTDYEAPDDYFGVIAAATVLDHPIRQRILEHGEANPFDCGFGLKLYYNFNHRQINEVSPRFTTWLGRMPHFVAHVKYANDVMPTFIQRFVWNYVVLSKAIFGSQKDNNSWVTPWLMVEVYKRTKHQSWFSDKVVALYQESFRDNWIYGIGTLMGEYFVNISHPLSKWGMGLFP